MFCRVPGDSGCRADGLDVLDVLDVLDGLVGCVMVPPCKIPFAAHCLTAGRERQHWRCAALSGFARCRQPGAVGQSLGQPLGHMPSVSRRFHTPIACAAAATWMVTCEAPDELADGREACLFTRISWNT